MNEETLEGKGEMRKEDKKYHTHTDRFNIQQNKLLYHVVQMYIVKSPVLVYNNSYQ